MPDTSTRFAISEPLADRSDSADVPLYIRNVVARLEALGTIYGQGLLSARPAAGVIGRVYWATDNDTFYYDDGATWNPVNQIGAGAIGTTQLADGSVTTAKLAQYAAVQQGTYAARPAAAAALNGTMYYATDQVALYVCIAAAWVRVGKQPGDIIWTAESAARTGYIIGDGSNISRTGINADLFAKWGTTFGVGDGSTTFGLPDLRGRSFAAVGTHADMSTIGNNEGQATVGNRRIKHKHTVGGGVIQGGSANQPGSNSLLGGNTGGANVTVISPLTVGPQTGAEPTDAGAYFVLQPQIKL